MRVDDFEYPDTAGYPDGHGFLDEGTADRGPEPLASELDQPSADLEADLLVVHDAVAGTYRALIGERQVAIIHAADDGPGVVTLRSTVVDATVRGRGLATDLIAHVLDEVRDSGSSIVVECSEVSRFLEHHPEYADLVA